MSVAQDILSKIKLLFNQDAAFYKLGDGTEIAISTLEVGGDVTIAGAPATAGDHTLEDGTIITVDETGKITNVKAVEAMEAIKLTDGSEIQVSSLEVGGAVSINGVPAPAAEYTLEDNRVISVDETGNITAITVPGVDLKTPEQLMAATQKFALGTPEERLNNLEVVAKALMEYSFGWQMREAQQKAVTDQAIATYKDKFSASEAKVKKQDELISQMIELVEEICKTPSGDAPKTKVSFSHIKAELKNESLGKYAVAAQKLKEKQAL